MNQPAPHRPRCSVFLATSLDGYLAGPDDALEWLHRFDSPDTDYGFEPFFASVDTVLLGRRTWDVVRGMEGWHYGEKRVAVLTHRPEVGDHGEVCLAGPPDAVLKRLAALGARHVYVDGGQAVRQFLEAGLVDELTLTVAPVILGGGVPLFQPGGAPRWLSLQEAEHWPNGLVQLRYGVATDEPAGTTA